MRTTLSLLSLLLLSLTAVWGHTYPDSLQSQAIIAQAVEKILQQDQQNQRREAQGQASLNNYVISIDTEHWIDEQGSTADKLLNKTDFERLSQQLQRFNNRRDGLRFYVVVVNNYVVKFETRIDPKLLADGFQWNHLQAYPHQQKVVRQIWNKAGALLKGISEELKSKGFPERIVYFYSQLQVAQYEEKPRFFKFDRLNFIGPDIEPRQEAIRQGIRVTAKQGNVPNIEQAITQIIHHTQAVVDGNEKPPIVDCNQTLVSIIANTQTIRGKDYDREVAAFAQLADGASAAQKPASPYVIFDQPENFAGNDIFTREVLPDKLNLLARPGASDYQLYVVFKEVKFVLPTSDWAAFAKEVAEKSSLAKQDKAILMVVPYFNTVCLGKNWLGGVGRGTSIVMPAVATSASLKGPMNTALATPGTSWEANFNQAFKQIPKTHTVYAYSMLWNGDFITHQPLVSPAKVTGFDHLYEIALSDDGRYEQLKVAESLLSNSLSRLQDLSTEGIGGVEKPDQGQELLDYLIQTSLANYFRSVETTMGNEQLIKIKTPDDIKESILADPKRAGQYSHWVWRHKTGGSGPDNLPFEALSPPHDWFYGGVNKVEAEGVMRTLDLVSFATSFVGADVLFDSYAAYYAYDKGFYGESALYVSAAVLTGVTALEMKLVMAGLKRAELALVKTIYSQKLVISPLTKGYLYASFLSIVVKLHLQEVVSKALVSAIDNKATFQKTLAYARKAEHKTAFQAFEKIVNEKATFRQLINDKPNTIDEFFTYYQQHPTATVEEVVVKISKEIDELKGIFKAFSKDQLDALGPTINKAISGYVELIDVFSFSKRISYWLPNWSKMFFNALCKVWMLV
jgi:hypothetical protein